MTTPKTNVAVLGSGTMGRGIAASLLRAGIPTAVWNRTPSRSMPLAAAGAHVATEVADAARQAHVAITMVTDADAVLDVADKQGMLKALPPYAVWVQMSTIGVEGFDRVREFADRERPDVTLVDAPVSGSSQPAEDGQLVILAAGAGSNRSRLEPIFEVLGRQTIWLEHVGDGSRLKLALNNWLSVLVEGMAETLTLSNALGLDPRLFVATIAGGPLASTYATDKAHAMLNADFAPGFPLRHAAKDAALAADAAHANGLELPLTAALLRRWRQAITSGHGDDDIASAVTASATTVSATTGDLRRTRD